MKAFLAGRIGVPTSILILFAASSLRASVPDVTPAPMTGVLQARIDALAAAGGGTLALTAGVYRTGALYFRPGVRLHLARGAEIVGSDRGEDYPQIITRIEGETCLYYPALLNADRCDGFSITGEGTIDGHGTNTWDAFWTKLREASRTKRDFRNKDLMRPRVLYVSNSRNVDIGGVTFKNSKFWTTHFYNCDNVRVHDCHIIAETFRRPDGTTLRGPSTDAVDIDKCRDFTVSNCVISVNDDGVVVKGGKGAWAGDDAKHPENGPSSNVLVTDCTFLSPTHACLTLGSECPEAHDIVLRNSTVACDKLLYLKMRTDTPQRYARVLVEGMRGQCNTFLTIGAWSQYEKRDGRSEAELMSFAEDITLRNNRVTYRTERAGQGEGRFFKVTGLKLENNTPE